MYGKVIRYQHHGRAVAGKEELKGKHREHCLCFECGSFAPGQPNNCYIAERLFAVCKEFGITTPVFECPAMVEGKPNLSAMPAPENLSEEGKK